MNKKIQGLSAIAFALCVGACEQQTLPAGTTAAPAPSTTPSLDAADASDGLNCKVELVNGAAVVEGKPAGPVTLPGKLEFSGWVILDHANRAPETVSVLISDSDKPGVVLQEILANERVGRPDVDEAFSARRGTMTGYAAQEATVNLPAGSYRVQVVGKDSGHRYLCPHLAQVDVAPAR